MSHCRRTSVSSSDTAIKLSVSSPPTGNRSIQTTSVSGSSSPLSAVSASHRYGQYHTLATFVPASKCAADQVMTMTSSSPRHLSGQLGAEMSRTAAAIVGGSPKRYVGGPSSRPHHHPPHRHRHHRAGGARIISAVSDWNISGNALTTAPTYATVERSNMAASKRHLVAKYDINGGGGLTTTAARIGERNVYGGLSSVSTQLTRSLQALPDTML